ncbi:hypothetical protein LIA77_11662 [Sarocladium implicatum]|nr:hypothetical protein LIA77_11662 [Sarocladium implicatum]
MAYPELKYYRFDGACTIAGHALMLQYDIPFTSVLVRVTPDGIEPEDGSLTPAEYRKKLSTFGTIPALTVDGVALSENPAVLTYLASLTPDERSLTGGEDPLQRAQVLSWVGWFSGVVHGRGFTMLFRPGKFISDEKQEPSVQELARGYLRTCFQRIEEQLQGRTYLVGDEVTIADYYAIVFYLWANKHDFGPMGEKYPGYGRLFWTMRGLKGVQAALERENVLQYC